MGHPKHYWFSGPKVWVFSAMAGLLIGAGATIIAPVAMNSPQVLDTLSIPIWLLVPFALMLGCIALMPFIRARIWETYYPDIAFLLGGTVVGYYLLSFGAVGRHAITHAALKYFQFIALIGSLYVVSGGVMIQITGRGRPLVNALLLVSGAVLANFVGTTGASMLLIRPFLRMNKGRIQPFHIALFIMIVSNCGGCLTPIGDPPLFLGYLKGIPFGWTVQHLWPAWLFVNGALLAIFFALDLRVKELIEANGHDETSLSIRSVSSILVLVLIIATVAFDSLIRRFAHLESIPCGAILQIAFGGLAYRFADKNILKQNRFDWHPVREVASLFLGIFATMVPALAYLNGHAATLGLSNPTHFYFATGALSGMLDNAPTYLSFLQAAFGVTGVELTPQQMPHFLSGTFAVSGSSGVSGTAILRAISLGAVFFGGMTYIGNGPNFMVKAIAEADKAPTPSFFGYLKYALLILLPVLIMAWVLFIRSSV